MNTQATPSKPPQTTSGPNPGPKPPADKAPSKKSAGPARRVFATEADKSAAVVRELFMPSCLASIIGEKIASLGGTKIAFDALMAEAENTKDPVERMLLEQMILAHFRLARLQVDASEAKGGEPIKASNGAAARLLGEFRRMALAIRQYRTPVSGKAFTVVHQQNVATAGGQQKVRYADRKGAPKAAANPPASSAPMNDNLHVLREQALQNRQKAAAKPAAAMG